MYNFITSPSHISSRLPSPQVLRGEVLLSRGLQKHTTAATLAAVSNTSSGTGRARGIGFVVAMCALFPQTSDSRTTASLLVTSAQQHGRFVPYVTVRVVLISVGIL